MVADFLIRIKNAVMAKNKEVKIVSNKHVLAVANSLKKLGFLEKVEADKVTLTFMDKKPILMDIKLVSKPGRRIYIGARELEKRKKPSILLISTPIGIISSKQALKSRIGGEVLAEVL